MSTRDKLLLAFASKRRETLSGTAIARRLGVTRASVWKAVDTLKEDGFPIESQGRQGYRLNPDFDLSLFELSQPRNGISRAHLHYRTIVPSTQLLAKQAAAMDAPASSVWVSERQTGGRGRLDRFWDSGMGGLWFSILLRPRLPAAKIPPFTLVAALRLRNVIEEITRVPARLKWPNDLIVETSAGRWAKLAGILTEMAGDFDRTHWVVSGIGINVNNDLPAALSKIAVSLKSITGRCWARAEILKQFVHGLQKDLSQFERSGFEAFRTAYWKHYGRPDEETVLQTARGERRGLARGVDASGAIIIESRRQIEHFSEGEIVV